MHEFKIIQEIFPIIENVAKENHLKKINKVFLKVGRLRQVILEFMQFAFATAAKGTVADNAELVIELVPVSGRCKFCGKMFEVEESIYICPYCDGVDLEIVTGKEIVVDGVDGER